MITKLTSVVPVAVNDMSASEYLLRAYPLLGKARLTALLRQRQLKIDGARAEADAQVHSGQELTLYVDGEYDRALQILENRDGLIAFLKPRGLPVDRDEYGIGEDTALSRLRLIEPDARLVHRLDAGTAGLMLAAVGEPAERELTNLFREHLIVKRYSATVIGRMPKRHDTLKAFLLKDSQRSTVRVSPKPLPGAQSIETVYTVTREFAKADVNLSKLNILIPTGRTHQIRAHMAYVGHPLLGDDKYGDRNVNKLLGVRETDLTSVEIAIKDVPEAGRYAGRRFKL